MTRLTELAPKKKGNCNVVATWPYHMISLVMTSNNIWLSLLIALTYYLVTDSSPFWYTKSHWSIIGNWLPRLHYWEAHQPLSHLLGSTFSVIILCWDSFLLLVLRSHFTIIEHLVLKLLQTNLGPSLDHIPSSEPEGLDNQLHGLLNIANTALWDVNVSKAFCTWILSND